jgi:hypothetical protein
MQSRRMLLLNASNHPLRLAYPYAFVQVSEVARRFGIEIDRQDLFGTSAASREHTLRRLIEQSRPDLIGITLRNTDSLLSADYFKPKLDDRLDRPLNRGMLETLSDGLPPYFPAHDTRELIGTIRAISSTPIIVGGFGFSVQPERQMRFLEPDFGLVGDPAPLFERFDDVLAGRGLSTIDNLCYFEGDEPRVNRRVFLGPSPNREYTDAIIDDRRKLFGAMSGRLPASSRAVPIEVMRGCPYQCSFCTEPSVKGKRAMFRDLEVVDEELEFLRRHDLNLVWFVCSEINAMGNAFPLELAERIIRLNERRSPSERIRWLTYYLLKFSRDELKTLRRSGFLGGWNDIPAFDDRNLKQLRVPYRTRHLVQSLKDVVAIRKEELAAAPPAGMMSFEQQLVFDPEHRRSVLPDDMFSSKVLTLFLGNQHVTIETVRETLRVMDDEGLADDFDSAMVIRGERVFEQRAAERNAPSTFSFERAGGTLRSLDIVNPTYTFPPALVRQVGSVEALERFFVHVEDTFLSRNHLFRKDWCWVLGTAISPRAFHALWLEVLATGAQPAAQSAVPEVRELLAYISTDPSVAKTSVLFNPPPDRRRIASRAADLALRAVLEAHRPKAARVLDQLDVPQQPQGQSALRPYQLTVHLYQRFDSNEQIREHVQNALAITPDSVEALALSELLERNGVDLQPAFKLFFIAPASAHAGAQSGAARPMESPLPTP